MPTPIRIVVEDLVLEGELGDEPVARALAARLPFDAPLRAEGGQLYIETQLELDIDSGTEVVESGDLAYWPEALALCFFCGETPASTPGSGAPVPSGEVERVGRFFGSSLLYARRHAAHIRVERARLP